MRRANSWSPAGRSPFRSVPSASTCCWRACVGWVAPSCPRQRSSATRSPPCMTAATSSSCRPYGSAGSACLRRRRAPCPMFSPWAVPRCHRRPIPTAWWVSAATTWATAPVRSPPTPGPRPAPVPRRPCTGPCWFWRASGWPTRSAGRPVIMPPPTWPPASAISTMPRWPQRPSPARAAARPSSTSTCTTAMARRRSSMIVPTCSPSRSMRIPGASIHSSGATRRSAGADRAKASTSTCRSSAARPSSPILRHLTQRLPASRTSRPTFWCWPLAWTSRSTIPSRASPSPRRISP